jgi:alpha-mannosidase/mannosylglycerate hydrolase
VEPLAAISQLRGFSIQKTYVDLAYKYLVQNHPHDSICGCSIDQVHKDMEYRFDQTRMICDQLITAMMNFEKEQHIIREDAHARILTVLNPLPFARRETIMVDIDFNKDYPNTYQEPFGYEEKNSFRHESLKLCMEGLANV